MIEVKSITKTYSTKGGTVHALDNVSIVFQESGMVFLLGKSGSGKSTLLNICGGLDSADSGEIIINGRSSRDFSPSDFDSYRNTFVGFIFQEYNVLEEFTVEENISLALELQGKSEDKERVAEILREVELEGLEKRKPNTLSGGQKQRVAIARALVKSPKIIMADEPSGALDSVTGKQVFDTLKKLSKDKLVIVVSHDADFAEQYADRIIELKDGKIITDVVRNEFQAEGENLSYIGENTISVRNMSQLSEEDRGKIDAFMQSRTAEVLITSDPKEIGVQQSSIKKYKKFYPTPVERERQVVEDNQEFIQSKLPLKHAVRMGLSGLKLHPIRLAITVILSTIAFVMFGLFSTLMFYDKDATTVRAIVDGNDTGIMLTKEYRIHLYSDLRGDYDVKGFETVFTESEIEALNEEYSEFNFTGIYDYRWHSLEMDSAAVFHISRCYYATSSSVLGFSEIPEEELADHGLKLFYGTYPKDTNEIAIPIYLAEILAYGGMFRTSEFGDVDNFLKQYDSIEDLIGEWVRFSTGATYKVTGIIDCGQMPEEFERLKEFATFANITYLDDRYFYHDQELYYQMQSLLKNSFHCVVFVGQGAYYRNKPGNSTDLTQVVTEVDSLYKDGETVYRHPDPIAAEQNGEKLYDYAVTSLYQKRKSQARSALSFSEVFKDDVCYVMQNKSVRDVEDAADILENLMFIVMVGGCTLAGFSALLMCNFIVVSIRSKEKEIGILRAVGARGTDVFKIFCIESMVIALCSWILALIITPIVCVSINSYLYAKAMVFFSLLSFNLAGILCTLLLSLLIGMVSTVIPIGLSTKRKPADVIRAL